VIYGAISTENGGGFESGFRMLIERGRIIKCEVYWMISVLMITVLAFGSWK